MARPRLEPSDSVSTVVLRVDIGWRSVAWALVGVGTAWLFLKIWPVAVLLVVALILVGTLNPLVVSLERRGLRRGAALAVVMVSLVAVLGLLAMLTLPMLVRQIGSMLADAPSHQAALVEWLRHHSARELARWVATLDTANLAPAAAKIALRYSDQALTIAAGAVSALVLAAYIMSDRERASATVYTAVPRRYHRQLDHILLRLEWIVGGYVRGQLITSALMFLFVLVLLAVLGVDNALALAVFAALTDALPYVGGLLGGVVVIAAALVHGPMTALIATVAIVVYQELESRLIVPRVYGRALRLSAAAVIVSLLVGGAILGVLGALLALPVAAGLRMIAIELRTCRDVADPDVGPDDVGPADLDPGIEESPGDRML